MHRIGTALYAPADLTWGRDDVLLQPDIFVIGRNEERLRAWSEFRSIPFIAEVLSPSTKPYDRFDKRRVYQERGVASYWIVDGTTRQVEVWTPEAHFPIVERAPLTWHASSAPAPLEIDLAWLFAE